MRHAKFTYTFLYLCAYFIICIFSISGNLFKEFVENVNQEFEKLHVSIHQTSVLKDNYVKNENISVNNGILPDNKLIDLAVRKESSKNYTNSELCEQRDDELNVKSEIKDLNSKESKPIYMTISDDKIAVDNAMHELTTQQLNDNPFLAEVFKEYLQDQDVNINQNENEISVQFHSHRRFVTGFIIFQLYNLCIYI